MTTRGILTDNVALVTVGVVDERASMGALTPDGVERAVAALADGCQLGIPSATGVR